MLSIVPSKFFLRNSNFTAKDFVLTNTSYLNSTSTTTKTSTFVEKSNVKIFDLGKPLEPENVYMTILCKKSASFFEVVTTLCIHDLSKDVHVSGAIWNAGVWEKGIMGNSQLDFCDIIFSTVSNENN